MSNFTLDTTILAKGIFPPRRRKRDQIYEEQFKLHTIAKSVIKRVEDKEFIMNVPSIGIIEIAAVGARLTGKEQRGTEASGYVKEHGNIIYDTDFLDEAVKIASKTKISGFDSVFIACAKITDSVLITDDKKMHDAALKIGIEAKFLRDMR